METSQIKILREKKNEKKNQKPQNIQELWKILRGVTGILEERQNRTDEIF